MSVFSLNYARKEIDWANDVYKEVSIKTTGYKKITIPKGRIKYYLHHDIHELAMTSYGLFIEGQLWMSITPMEVQSHVLPIKLAKGRVGIGGLGMGYVINRILDKEDVLEVVVYEKNRDVIDLYTTVFGLHPKLTIIEQDVLKLENETFDFFYMDIYPSYVHKDVLEHMWLMKKYNTINHYHFWGLEKVLLELIVAGIPCSFQVEEQAYKDFLMALLDKTVSINVTRLAASEYVEEIYNYDLEKDFGL